MSLGGGGEDEHWLGSRSISGLRDEKFVNEGLAKLWWSRTEHCRLPVEAHEDW